MLKQEFDDRIGRVSEMSEFEFANRIYMVDDRNKDEFCEEYNTIEDMGIYNILVGMYKAVSNTAELLNDRIERMVAEHQSEVNEIKMTNTINANNLINRLMDANADMMSGTVRDIIVEQIGRKELIKYKIKNHITLWEDEKEWLLELL